MLDILSLDEDDRFTVSSGSDLRYHFTIGSISSDEQCIQIGCVVEADGKTVESAQINYDACYNTIDIVCGCGECLCISSHAEDICMALNLISTKLEDNILGVCTEHDCGNPESEPETTQS